MGNRATFDEVNKRKMMDEISIKKDYFNRNSEITLKLIIFQTRGLPFTELRNNSYGTRSYLGWSHIYDDEQFFLA